MRAFVLTDATLSRHAGRFVWLATDMENAKNAEFRRRFPVPALPSYLVLDPTGSRVTLRWVGGMTVAQMHTLLDDLEHGGGAPPALLARLAVADSLYGANDYAAAVPALERVLADGPATWRGRTRVVESLTYALTQADQSERALALARRELPGLGRTVSALGVASTALDAAAGLPDTVPAMRAGIAEFEPVVRALVADTTFTASGDDRSGAWIALLDARQALHDSAGAAATAHGWSEFLDGAAARARTPAERAVYDSHRLSAYLEIGQPERAVPMLEQSERDFPDDYNPPARLATAYRALRRWDEALAASDRAMKLAYGPRRLLLVDTRAEIFRGRGDIPGVRRTLEEGIAYGQALPESQRPAARIAALQRKLAALPVQ